MGFFPPAIVDCPPQSSFWFTSSRVTVGSNPRTQNPPQSCVTTLQSKIQPFDNASQPPPVGSNENASNKPFATFAKDSNSRNIQQGRGRIEVRQTEQRIYAATS